LAGSRVGHRRERDPRPDIRIGEALQELGRTASVTRFAVAEEVPGHDLVVLDPDPDDRHLRAAVGVEGDQVRERSRLDQGANRFQRRTQGMSV
jgi:hypothetical protein